MRIIYALIVSIILANTLTGCSSAQTAKRANDFRQVAQTTQTTADKVRSILTQYPAGAVEGNELAVIVLAVLPDAWKVKYQQAVSIATDTRAAAWDIVQALESTASDSLVEATKLDEQAARQADKWANLSSITQSILSVALAPEGAVMVGLGLLAGFFRRKQNQAVAVTQDIVTSIKASPTISAAIKGEGGDDLRKSYQPATMKVVKKIIDNH